MGGGLFSNETLENIFRWDPTTKNTRASYSWLVHPCSAVVLLIMLSQQATKVPTTAKDKILNGLNTET